MNEAEKKEREVWVEGQFRLSKELAEVHAAYYKGLVGNGVPRIVAALISYGYFRGVYTGVGR